MKGFTVNAKLELVKPLYHLTWRPTVVHALKSTEAARASIKSYLQPIGPICWNIIIVVWQEFCSCCKDVYLSIIFQVVYSTVCSSLHSSSCVGSLLLLGWELVYLILGQLQFPVCCQPQYGFCSEQLCPHVWQSSLW